MPLTRKVWDPSGKISPIGYKGICSNDLFDRKWSTPAPFPRLIWHHWTHLKSALRKSIIISFNLHFSRALTLPINSFIHPNTAVRNWGAGMSRGMIIGHSFVAGLADHLAGQHGLPDGTYRWPSEVASDLRVSDQMDGVFLSGVRGASLCDGRYKLPTIAIDNERPHFVVLQIGTNDLACGVPPYEVACEVLNTAHELVMDYGVMRVVICGALYRIGHLRVPSHVDFDAVIDSYNTILREMCASERFVVYRSHSGFWGNPIHTWSRDGIHPNTSFGRKLYIKSLRQILLETSSFLRQPLSARHQ